MTVVVTESSDMPQGGTYMVTITSISPKIMGKVDGSNVAVPMSRPAGLSVAVNNRFMAQLRAPLPPLLQSNESGS